MKYRALIFTFALSLVYHGFLLFQKSLFPVVPKVSKEQAFKFKRLRLVGIKNGKRLNLLTLPNTKDPKQELNKKKPTPTLKKLSYNELPYNKYIDKILEKKKKSQQVSVKNFLKTPRVGFQSSRSALNELALSNLNIKFELPEGVSEDQLNKRELVFYSFQKRTVQAYINSFIKELNEFNKRNPRKSFPLTSRKQKLISKLIYDRNGDIISIKSLAWSDIDELQNFFLKVLDNLQTIPNPPSEIIENEQFAINFVLTVND